MLQLKVVSVLTSSSAAHSVCPPDDGAEHTKHTRYSVFHFSPLLSFGMFILYHRKPSLSNAENPLLTIKKFYIYPS